MKTNKRIVILLVVALCIVLFSACMNVQDEVIPTEATITDVAPTEGVMIEDSDDATVLVTEHEEIPTSAENQNDLLADVGDFSGEWEETDPTESDKEAEDELRDPTELPVESEPNLTEPTDDEDNNLKDEENVEDPTESEDNQNENQVDATESEAATEPTVTAGNDDTLSELGDVPEY